MVEVAGTGLAAIDWVFPAEPDAPFETLGGSCGNVLLSLAMLNRQVAPILSLGLDEAGERIFDEFEGAGADVRFINRCPGQRSPVIAQHLNAVGQHHFSFTCPTTSEPLPRYRAILGPDLDRAREVLAGCRVFYSDRYDSSVVEGMEAAALAGATVFFEPARISVSELFERAIGAASIVKVSSEQVLDLHADPDTIVIVTHGSSGLEIRKGEEQKYCGAYPATTLRDTCGAGDMVSVAIIDWILGKSLGRQMELEDLLPGVVAGQRLAAENCAYHGARGVFVALGPEHARQVIDAALR